MNKIYVYGIIGDPIDGLDAASFRDSLEDAKGDITVHISSYGGAVSDGVSIYNMLRAHKGDVHVVVDGVAASSASVVAMAGDTITMKRGTLMMLHNPWCFTAGDSDDHRAAAGMLDKHADALVEIYASRSGLSHEDVRQVMADETWLTADEAVGWGFAQGESEEEADPEDIVSALERAPDIEEVVQSLPERVCAAVSPYFAARAAANGSHKLAVVKASALPTKKKGDEMDGLEKNKDDVAAKAQAAERERVSAVMAACRKGGMEDLADKFIADGTSVDEVRAHILDRLAEERVAPGGPVAEVKVDAKDKLFAGAKNALSARAKHEKLDEGNPFAHMTLKELASEFARADGIDTRGLTGTQLVGKVLAVGYHTTRDFPTLLSGLAATSLARGYAEAEMNFEEWTSEGQASNFQEITRTTMGLYPSLPEVTEGSEYTYATIGEEGRPVKVSKFGSIFAITREAIVNDNHAQFTRVPSLQGAAARRTIQNAATDVLVDNALAGGGDIFSAGNNNQNLSLDLDVDGVMTGLQAMMSQADTDGNPLQIRPAILLVPVALYGKAMQLVVDDKYVDSNNAERANPIRGLLRVVADPRLDMAGQTDYWYLIADPAQYDFVEVTYLEGQTAPTLEQRQGWHVDGTEFKVRMEFGAAALDYRTAFRGKES